MGKKCTFLTNTHNSKWFLGFTVPFLGGPAPDVAVGLFRGSVLATLRTAFGALSIPAAPSWTAPSISGRTSPRPRGTRPPRPYVRTHRAGSYRMSNPNGLPSPQDFVLPALSTINPMPAATYDLRAQRVQLVYRSKKKARAIFSHGPKYQFSNKQLFFYRFDFRLI